MQSERGGGGGGGEREKETDRQTDRQTETEKQTDREVETSHKDMKITWSSRRRLAPADKRRSEVG